MKTGFSRKLTRSLPTLVSPSRSSCDKTSTLPDYYRNTRREVYGPHSRIESVSLRTMESSYIHVIESDRSSFLLNFEFPDDEELEAKTRSTETTDSFSLYSTYCEGVELPPSLEERRGCVSLGLSLLQNFISLLCGRRRRWVSKN